MINTISKDYLGLNDNLEKDRNIIISSFNDKITNIIRSFNIHVKNDKKTEQIILPLGDGLTICRKL